MLLGTKKEMDAKRAVMMADWMAWNLVVQTVDQMAG